MSLSLNEFLDHYRQRIKRFESERDEFIIRRTKQECRGLWERVFVPKNRNYDKDIEVIDKEITDLKNQDLKVVFEYSVDDKKYVVPVEIKAEALNYYKIPTHLGKQPSATYVERIYKAEKNEL